MSGILAYPTPWLQPATESRARWALQTPRAAPHEPTCRGSQTRPTSPSAPPPMSLPLEHKPLPCHWPSPTSAPMKSLQNPAAGRLWRRRNCCDIRRPHHPNRACNPLEPLGPEGGSSDLTLKPSSTSRGVALVAHPAPIRCSKIAGRALAKGVERRVAPMLQALPILQTFTSLTSPHTPGTSRGSPGRGTRNQDRPKFPLDRAGHQNGWAHRLGPRAPGSVAPSLIKIQAVGVIYDSFAALGFAPTDVQEDSRRMPGLPPKTRQDMSTAST